MFGHHYDSFKRKANSSDELTPALTDITFPNDHQLTGYVITILTRSTSSTERTEIAIGSIIESIIKNETPDCSSLKSKTYRIAISNTARNEHYYGIENKDELLEKLRGIIQTNKAEKENQAPGQNTAKRLKSGQ